MNRTPFKNGNWRLVLSFDRSDQCGYCEKTALMLNIGDEKTFFKHIHECKHNVTMTKYSKGDAE